MEVRGIYHQEETVAILQVSKLRPRKASFAWSQMAMKWWMSLTSESLHWFQNAHTVMAAHSSTLAWKIPWTEEPGLLCPWGCKDSDTTEQLHFH